MYLGFICSLAAISLLSCSPNENYYFGNINNSEYQTIETPSGLFGNTYYFSISDAIAEVTFQRNNVILYINYFLGAKVYQYESSAYSAPDMHKMFSSESYSSTYASYAGIVAWADEDRNSCIPFYFIKRGESYGVAAPTIEKNYVSYGEKLSYEDVIYDKQEYVGTYVTVSSGFNFQVSFTYNYVAVLIDLDTYTSYTLKYYYFTDNFCKNYLNCDGPSLVCTLENDNVIIFKILSESMLEIEKTGALLSKEQ